MNIENRCSARIFRSGSSSPLNSPAPEINLREGLVSCPHQILTCSALALAEVLIIRVKSTDVSLTPTRFFIKTPEDRIVLILFRIMKSFPFGSRGLNPVLHLKELRAGYIGTVTAFTWRRSYLRCLKGKFVSIRGTISRVCNIKPLVSQMAFQCEVCDEKQTLLFSDGRYSIPGRCSLSMCRSKQFIPLRSPEDGTKTVDWQRVRLQELAVDESAEDASRIPKSVECELSGNLVGSCVPGDVVRICGVVKAGSTDESSGKSSGNSLYTLFIQANSLINEKKVPEGGQRSCIWRAFLLLCLCRSQICSAAL